MDLDRRNTPVGVGLGLRFSHLSQVRDGHALGRVRFLELAPENFAERGDFVGEAIRAIAGQHPLLSHGLSLSLGGTDPLDMRLLRALRSLLAELRVPWHSDHLSFSSYAGVQLHELMPIPFTEAMAQHVADRVRWVEDALHLPMAVENISAYLPQVDAAARETEFIARVLELADCGLLLDLNNVHVNAHNHAFNPLTWLHSLPLTRVIQVHVAGPELWEDGLMVDTHGSPVPERVRDMLAFTLARTGPVPVLLERDSALPPLVELLAEVEDLQGLYDIAVAKGDAHAA
jgi:uncharacterized protein (UPF0276 family)